MTSLRHAWSALPSRLKILDPVAFSADEWRVLERLHQSFEDRDAHTRLPIPIARFRADAVAAILAAARTLDDVATGSLDDDPFARAFAGDVDEIVRVLVPAARYRKGHFAHGRFTVPQPHGLHTDHSQEDPAAGGEPICIARIGTLGTHYVAGDYRAHDAGTQRLLAALRYWTAVPEGEPEAIFEALLARGTLRTIPVNHVVLMVAGNPAPNAQVTQHIAARPPAGGVHSAFFQRQYRLGLRPSP